MNIKLITGASTYEACINTIKQIDVTKNEETNLLVVPDAFSMQAENLLFDVLNLKSVFNVEVVGISKLAGRILRDNNLSYVRVSGLEEVFNVYKATRICKDDFQYFGEFDVDFCSKLLQIIKQFKGCRLAPKDIKPTGDLVLDRKMHDIKLVYTQYELLLGEKLDLSKMLELCSENLADKVDLSKVNLYFANFDSFSLEINSFICKLAEVVGSVCIGMSRPLCPNNAFIFEDDILKKTTALAKEHSILVEIQNFATNMDDTHQKMAKNLFGFEVEKGVQCDYFLNVMAKNKQDELEFVAKYIKNALFHGARLKDFAVAVSQESYFDKLKSLFEKYEISFYSDEAVRLSDTLLCRFLLKMIEFAKLGINQERLKYIANNTFFEATDRDLVLRDINYFNIDDKEEFLQRFPEFEKVVSQIDLLSRGGTITSFVNTLRSFIDLIDENYQKAISKLNEKKFFKEESQNRQALSLCQQVFDKLEILGENEKMSLIDFENLLILSFNSVKVETIPTYIDAVYVGDATKSYFEDVKTLFVLGATASALPVARADTGLIDDDDIEKLRINFLLEPEIKVLNRRSRLKLFECLLHAKEKLVVSCPAVEDGRVSEPSGFVKDLRLIFGENLLHTVFLEEINSFGTTEQEKLDNLLFFIGSKDNLSSVYTLLKNKEKLPIQFEGAIAKNLESEPFKASPQERLSSQTKDILIKHGRVSASQLETYFSCPFRHFVSYGLKIKENENIEPNKRLFGVFVHALLEKFVSQFADVGILTSKEIDKFININVSEIAKDVYDKKILARKHFLSFLKNESKIILDNAVYEQKWSAFRPKLLEEKILQNFSLKEKIVGYVDRIDVCGDKFRIIDYKTGKTQTIKKDLYYGKKLQLFLYASAIKTMLGLQCCGVYYFDCQTKYAKGEKSNRLNGLTLADDNTVFALDKRLGQEEFKSDIVGFALRKSAKDGEFSFKGGNVVESFDELFDYSTAVSKQAIQEIRDGYILDKPFAGECQRCPFNAICCHKDSDGFRLMQTVLDENFKESKSEN